LEVAKPTNALYDSLKSVVKAKGQRGFDCPEKGPYYKHAVEFHQLGMAVRLDLGRLEELMRRWFRQAQRMLHMMVGLAFLVLALAGALLSISEWRLYRENRNLGLTHFGFFLGFTIFLVILSLYSFVKARSVR